MKNLLKSASVAGIVFGLGLIGSSAFAQQSADGSKNTSQSSTSGSYDGNAFTKNYSADNGNTKTITSDNGNDQSTHLAYSRDNGNNQSTNVSKDNGNDQSTHLAYSRDNGNNESTNVSKDNGNDQSTHLAYSRDNGNNQSTNSSLTIGDITVALSTADLSGSVSGQSFKAGDGGSIASGALRLQGNAMQGFAGINNASYITGQGSLGQAMNSVTATSSVTFQ